MHTIECPHCQWTRSRITTTPDTESDSRGKTIGTRHRKCKKCFKPFHTEFVLIEKVTWPVIQTNNQNFQSLVTDVANADDESK